MESGPTFAYGGAFGGSAFFWRNGRSHSCADSIAFADRLLDFTAMLSQTLFFIEGQ